MNEHGQLLFYWEKDTLIINAKGPFNEKGALAETNKIKKLIMEKNVTKWCKLGIWDDESFGSAKSIAIVESYHQWCIENGCVKTACVVCNSLQKSIAEKVYNGTAKICQSERDAKGWLLSDI